MRDVIDYFTNYKEQLLEAVFAYNCCLPPHVRKSERMDMDNWFKLVLKEIMPKSKFNFCDSENKPYDTTLFGKKISNKFLSKYPFSRRSFRGSSPLTKPDGIQLKNVRSLKKESTKLLSKNDCDFLQIIVYKEKQYKEGIGIYLFEFDFIIDLLESTHENGHVLHQQQVFIENESNALLSLKLDNDLKGRFESKWQTHQRLDQTYKKKKDMICTKAIRMCKIKEAMKMPLFEHMNIL